jgi:hypothetical protein
MASEIQDPSELSTDELVAAMERDEAEGAEFLSPREFAQLIGVQPQLVYYYIRQGKIEAMPCICGRKVVNVAAAREFFDNKGKQVDTRPDPTE